MSSNGSTNSVTAIEIDMRDIPRERKARLSDVSRETNNDYFFFGLRHISSIGSRDRSSH